MAGGPIETPREAAARFLGSLRRPLHILVAISGGSDSTGLLAVLVDEIRVHDLPHRISAATVDHDLRSGSADEARSVAELCGRLGVPHRTGRWIGEKPRSGIMAAAREARYELLADIASEMGADIIVTAHTFGDQQETLAMRRARVADAPVVAATGIADAVLFDRRIWVVRPFLCCLRNDIRTFLKEHDLGWIDDPSNADFHYERIRVRAELAKPSPRPLAGGEGTKSGLSRAAARWVEQFVTVHAGLLCRVDLREMNPQAPEFAYGLSCLTAIFGGQPFGLGQERLRRILDFIGEGSPGRRTAGGVVFDIRRDGLYLMRESRNIAALTLAPGARGIWDGRFEVINEGARSVRIVAGGSRTPPVFPIGTPKGAAARAAASAPSVLFDAEPRPDEVDSVRIVARLAPFDRFLTRFDLTLADQLAKAFERSAYLSLPLQELLTENACGGVDCLGKGPA